MIPAITLLTQRDVARNYPALQPILQALGNPSQRTMVIGGMLVIVGMYLIKTLFLALLAWWQTRFAFGVQAQLSQRLFTVYLRQPYTCHLPRNSAHLIRNVITEVGMFTFNGIQPGITVLAESLVLLGLCSLLLVVEPLGALSVVSVLGAAAWGFHRLTRGLGTRRAEETQLRPKPMGEIGGHPILWHIIMKIYSAHGIDDLQLPGGGFVQSPPWFS